MLLAVTLRTRNPPHVPWSCQADLGFMAPLGVFSPSPAHLWVSQSLLLHPNLSTDGKRNQHLLCPSYKPFIRELELDLKVLPNPDHSMILPNDHVEQLLVGGRPGGNTG